MEKDQNYTNHILDSIAFIEKSVAAKSFTDLKSDRGLQDIVVRELEIIGEASKRLSNEFRNQNREIPWKKIAGTRDRLIHDYFKIDFDIVWKAIKEDLPKLKSALQS